MLIGLGKMFKNVASTLASKILGYVYTPSPGSGYYTTRVGTNSEAYLMIASGDFGQRATSLLYSTDGSTWVTSPMQGLTYDYRQFNELVYGNNTWFAPGIGDSMYSTDGINWSSSTGLSNINMYKAVYSGRVNTWIAYGATDTPGEYRPYISIDNAKTWQALSFGSYINNIFNTAGPGISLLEVGNGNVVIYAYGTSEVVTIEISNGGTLNSYYYTSTNLPALSSSNASSGIVLSDPEQSKYRVIFIDGKDLYYSGYYSYLSFTKIENVFGSTASEITLHNTKTRVDPSSATSFKNNITATFFNGTYSTYAISYSDDGVSWSGPYTYTAKFGSLFVPPTDIRTLNDKLITHGSENLSRVAYSEWAGSSYNSLFASIDVDFSNTFNVVGEIGVLNTLKETQISIGGQGSGETVETLGQVDVYTVPSGKSANINMITIENLSSNAITYDLGIVNTGTTLTSSNTLKWDQPIAANSTVTVLDVENPVTAGKTVYVFPSAVDQVQVKVYGTETSV